MAQGPEQNQTSRLETLVCVERDQEWWQSVYTICLTEVTRAICEKDDLELEHIFQILPVLAEAADSPELETLEAELRLIAERHFTEVVLNQGLLPGGVGV